jgi:hypothetical protein
LTLDPEHKVSHEAIQYHREHVYHGEY